MNKKGGLACLSGLYLDRKTSRISDSPVADLAAGDSTFLYTDVLHPPDMSGDGGEAAMSWWLEATIFLLNLSIAAVISWHSWTLLGKGKLFSRPLWRYPLFKPIVDPYTGRTDARNTRLWQIVVVTVAVLGIVLITDRHMLVPQSTTLTLLYIDDYLTGDDEKWKKFKNTVRNKIKWRIHVPRPVAG